MKKLTIITIILIFVTIGGYFCYDLFFQNDIKSYLIIDINPSLEMGVSKDGEVLSVIPLNSDADILLSDIDLIGLKVEDASQKVVDEAIESGYIDEYNEDNKITIYSTDEDEKSKEQKQTKIIEKINNSLKQNNIRALVVSGGLTEEMKTEADTYGISYGKYLLVSRLASINTQYTKEDIIKMSVKEIQKNIKTSVNERRDTISKNKEELETNLKNLKKEKTKNHEKERKQIEKQKSN